MRTARLTVARSTSKETLINARRAKSAETPKYPLSEPGAAESSRVTEQDGCKDCAHYPSSVDRATKQGARQTVRTSENPSQWDHSASTYRVAAWTCRSVCPAFVSVRVHAATTCMSGAGGFYYRATLPRTRNAPSQPKLPDHVHAADVAMEDIESAEASTIVDVDSADLIAEMHAKRRRLRLWPWVLAFGIGGYAGMTHRWPSLPAGVIIGFLVLVATLGAILFDRIRKTTVLMYDFEPGAEKGFEQLHAAFDALASCGRRWHISAQGRVRDQKYHAGASSLVKRTAIVVGRRSPPFVKTNITVPFVPVGKQTLYFFS